MIAASARTRLREYFLWRDLLSRCRMVPANAQKQGGSITVGLELDIPASIPSRSVCTIPRR